HHGVKEGGASDPWEQRRVFDRVPGPVTAPAENGISPVRTEEDADGLEAPGDHGPTASDVNPFLAGIAPQKCCEREGEWNREAGVAEIQHGRMNHHLWILKQRVAGMDLGGVITISGYCSSGFRP